MALGLEPSLTLRLLSLERWPAGVRHKSIPFWYKGTTHFQRQGGSQAGDAASRNTTCVLHLISEGARAGTIFSKYGLWYLPPPSPP